MRTKTALKEREKQNNPKSQCELKSIRGRKHSKGNIEPRAMVFHKKPSKSQFYFSSSTLLSVLKVHIKKTSNDIYRVCISNQVFSFHFKEKFTVNFHRPCVLKKKNLIFSLICKGEAFFKISRQRCFRSNSFLLSGSNGLTRTETKQ